MKSLFMIKPLWFSSRESKAMVSFFTALRENMANVRYLPAIDNQTIASMTFKFFSCDASSPATALTEGNYVLTSCDHNDAEAVSASRLLYNLLQKFSSGC